MSVQNLRAKIGARLNGNGEAGFTLIELLVVMLILGILAAIALPAFFNQKDKAGDAKAKEYAHSAQVAMETYSTDHNGSYTGATKSELIAIEPTLSNANFTVTVTSSSAYEIAVVGAKSTQIFKIVNNAGTLTFPCEEAGKGGCPSASGGGKVGDWGG
jgi:type IV pilus assembly protein PilA